MTKSESYTYGIYPEFLDQLSHLGSDLRHAMEQAIVDICLEEVPVEQVVDHWYLTYGYKPNAAQTRQYPKLIRADSFKKWLSRLKHGQHDNASNLIIIHAALSKVLLAEGKEPPSSVSELFYAQDAASNQYQIVEVINELSVPRIEVESLLIEPAIASASPSGKGEIHAEKQETQKNNWFWLAGFGLLILPLMGAWYFVSIRSTPPEAGVSVIAETLFEPLRVDPAKKLIELPGTSGFEMGCSDKNCRAMQQPPHRVTVRPFLMSQTEVSFHLYDQFCEETGRSLVDDMGWGRGESPVINISWNEANEFIDWLNQKIIEENPKSAGWKPFRLPTEAEWEYAARAAKQSRYSWGDSANGEYANGDQQYGWPQDMAPIGTLPVASLRPSEFGLYDMTGNVSEWVSDCWHENYEGAPLEANQSWEDELEGNCERRVHRGGAHRGPITTLLPTTRSWKTKDFKSDYIGVRLARDL